MLQQNISIGVLLEPKTFTFSDNLWYCRDKPAASRPTLPVKESRGIYGRDPRIKDPESGDWSLGIDSPAEPLLRQKAE